MTAVPRCDGIPLQDYKFYDYKKVVPPASGLNNSYDPEQLFKIIVQQIIELKRIPYSNILKIMIEYDDVINYLPEPLFGFYLTESAISPS